MSFLDSTCLMTSCLTHGRYSTNTRGGEDRREGGRKGRRERGGRRAERKERREAVKAAGGNN